MWHCIVNQMLRQVLHAIIVPSSRHDVSRDPEGFAFDPGFCLYPVHPFILPILIQTEVLTFILPILSSCPS